ncbi:MAG: hypothetical protein KME60_23340 [Cyanomargarita calcarea GSE-NOS-MK-12-04C]|uniref:Uncharacterized protein n=1 Tax=Cyanomargarita calcarea GSE-NOS-MK-12-04C TaxID=2839659 RepID=A0A951QQS5_9CYAN|nr:hypothetical protein [Cyanomargarita calcarea GSE-NOS-MK-12-04C]
MYSSTDIQTYWQQIQNHLKSEKASYRYIKLLRQIFLLGLILHSIHLMDTRPERLPLENALLALGITWLGFLPMILYLYNRNRPPMPFFPLVGLFYATSFGLPNFNADNVGTGRLTLNNVTTESLELTLIALAGMNIAYILSKSWLLKNVTPIKLADTYPVKKLINFLWILLLAHISYLYIPAIKNIPSIGQLLDPLGYVTYGLFYILSHGGFLPQFQAGLLLFVFLPIELIPRLASGLLAEIMVFFLFMFNVVWYTRKRIPIVVLTILGIVYLTFAPVKEDYRKLTWNKNNPASSGNPIEKLQVFVDLAVDYHQKNTFGSESNNSINEKQKKKDKDKLVSRSAHIITLSAVVEDTPDRVPYWNGVTYLPVFTKYIPRLVWPDKPAETVGNEFGRRYNYLQSDDDVTSYNLPWIVEMYANFGRVGVVGGMSLLGLLLAFLEQKMNHPAMNAVEFVFGATCLFGLVYQEANFSLIAGNIMNLSVALYLIFKFISK